MLYVIHVYCNASHYTHVDPKIWIILLLTLIPLEWESRRALYILLCLWIYIMILLMLQSIMYFFFILEAIFFSVSLTDRIFVLSFPLKKKNWDSFLSCWTLNFRVRLYFISQNVVIFFYFASFVLMLDVLFLSLGHYLIFKRAFKKWKCFWNLICEVYFMNDFFFKNFIFAKKVWALKERKLLEFCLFRQKGHVLGIQFVILNRDDVRKFTNMRSEVRSFLFGGRGYMYDVVL